MRYVERYNFLNFLNLLLPHGEDNISFEKRDGDLRVTIPYNDRTQSIRLLFESCSYQYVFLVPGYCPEELASDFIYDFSRVYELFDTKLLYESEAISESYGYKPNRRHFFFYLEWENVAFHVIAKSCEFTEANGPL
ncbi:hypothetical protein [Palleronia caenipelagi]|uniref:Uncharacterized protein n=1 Tax=Palleronia caenipelagi TaxID=2489174 RepID=A0A547PJV3_9RHOB|nr:hypothetical protein [Palleronia caenipelagi]TRD14442.1 hypothetical protein FEV53_18920 [Palleronia caenipelagi]